MHLISHQLNKLLVTSFHATLLVHLKLKRPASYTPNCKKLSKLWHINPDKNNAFATLTSFGDPLSLLEALKYHFWYRNFLEEDI